MKGLANKLRRSLPARLLLVFIVVCLCVITLIAATLAKGFGNQWQAGVKPHLEQYLNYVITDIGNPPNLERAAELAKRLPINIYISGPGEDYSSTGIPIDINNLEFHYDHRRWRKHASQHSLPRTRPSLSFGELDDRTVVKNALGEHTVYFEILHGIREARQSSAIHSALFLLLGILVAAYFFLRRMLRPVQDIKHGVSRIGQGELSYRVPVRNKNDLGELANSINQMADDISGMLSAKRQLLLALSHELRSPLTRAKIAVNMLDQSATQQSIDEDLSEMQSLITEILEAERINGRHASLTLKTLDPTLLVEQVTQEFADAKLTLDMKNKIPAMALDETRIKLLLRNLIKNALTHSDNDARPPIVHTHLKENNLELAVQDFGSGISQEHLPHITEPFYRADPSRTRSTGGFGLGLHLCKLIAEAHDGTLQIESTMGEGTTMTVILPRKVS